MSGLQSKDEALCSVEGIMQENDVVRLNIDSWPYTSYVKSITLAHEGLITVAAPIDEDYEEKVSLQDTIEVVACMRDALVSFLALVVEEPNSRTDNLKLGVYRVVTAPRHDALHAACAIPVSYRASSNTNWHYAEAIDLGTSGVTFKTVDIKNWRPGTLMDIIIEPPGQPSVRSQALLVKNDEKIGHIGNERLLNIVFTQMDCSNRILLYKLIRTCLLVA